MLRTVQAVRYLLPFREGGSVPALVEADDSGMYVVKLRGAAQGAKALIAEIVAGEIARALGIIVPAIVLVDLARAMADSEPDPEICLPLSASVGINVGLDYLPGSVTFDPIATPPPDAETASRLVLFDAMVTNVDRTVRNTNLLYWHKKIWAIDHGAALFFHHGWDPNDRLEGAREGFPEISDHVLLRWASDLERARAHFQSALTQSLIREVVELVPEELLAADRGFDQVEDHRAAYTAWLMTRIATLPALAEEAEGARTRRV